MLTVVCWLWEPAPRYRTKFDIGHVNRLRNMVLRNLTVPHRFVCVTDIGPTGRFMPDVELVPLSWFPHVEQRDHPNKPNCYRRLRAFSPEVSQWFGDRFLSLDLDCVVTGNINHIVQRTEDFVMWGGTTKQTTYNGSMWMMTTGARRQVWDKFDPALSPSMTRKVGKIGSDQAWIDYVLGPGEAMWTVKDGVYSFRNHLRRAPDRLPADARIVHFHGQANPWDPDVQRLEWVRKHYR